LQATVEQKDTALKRTELELEASKEREKAKVQELFEAGEAAEVY
jgi:hypothetical protein